MVVAMIAVGMMQVGFDEIIDMVAVRHRLVPAIRAVFVPELVTAVFDTGMVAVWAVPMTIVGMGVGIAHKIGR